MKPRILFIAIVWLICTNFSFSEDVTYRRFVDKKVAGLIVGEDGVEKVIKLYGRGLKREVFQGEILCYYNADEQTYFIVASYDRIIQSIILTERLEDKEQRTKSMQEENHQE